MADANEVKPVEKTYGGGFFRRRNKLAWRVGLICETVAAIYEPKSLIDLGCANGDLVGGFNDLGVAACGIEGSSACLPHLACEKDRVMIHDLREPVLIHSKFDLCTCLEVLEHIEPEFANVIANSLAGLSNQLLVSAAPPGQGGIGHVNCQPKEYWIEKFAVRGFVRDKKKDELLLDA